MLQEQVPTGASLLEIILSSDKTTISVMTGNHVVYPLLISLANICKEYQLKNSHNTFMLLALLPIAKFIHKTPRICSLLQDHLIHASLDHIFKPMKMAAINGIMMSDSLGFQRFCFPFIASYTVDTPEAQMLACVSAKSSPVTAAFYKSLGDDFQHEPHTASITMAQINNILLNADLLDLPAFLKEAQKSCLSSVLAPFWRDWCFAHPCIFLTPEPLHHWHKQFWDHDCKWCI